MPIHLAPCFWGVPDQDAFLNDLGALLHRHFGGLDGVFAGDNLITIGRNLSFRSDAAFMRAFNETIHPRNTVGQGIIWRFYTFAWAARSSLRLPGDFVECGVSMGSSSKIMCDYIDFANVSKKLYLFDVFGSHEKLDTTVYFGDQDSVLDSVAARFASYPNVVLVPGFIPDTFARCRPSRIAFLHVDLNNVDAEIAVLEHLFDAVVPGGIILFDDYGANGFVEQKRAEDDWLGSRGYFPLELPSGQGLVIK